MLRVVRCLSCYLFLQQLDNKEAATTSIIDHDPRVMASEFACPNCELMILDIKRLTGHRGWP